MQHATYTSNPVLEKLPAHLKQFIKPQNYEEYTAIDQAVWRYVMRKNVNYLSKVAHKSYVNGLAKTGISINNIPSMYGMNRILKDIGWAAVAVDGFIPPAAFMEFQAYNVLVIASDIRQLENIAYTPAPDIIHEGAGHAPIIANAQYAEYLRRFGEIGCKAISSAKDYELYEAVRHLSQIKEVKGTPIEEIKAAEATIEKLQANMGQPSEMAQIRNLHWWSVEYGLVGELEDPKIYGAGLLSSIGESIWCMSPQVKKMPYTIAAANTSFDITKPQPQLFVTPSLAHLSQVLEDFANTMALRTGGLEGIHKLINANALGTVGLSTGLQISGVFTKVIAHKGKPIYVQTTGKTALAYHDKELIGHGIEKHHNGFGTPIGKLKGINLAIENMSPRDLQAYAIREGQKVSLEFEGNIMVNGEIITGTRNLQGKILLITFQNCTVSHKNEVLFSAANQTYSMAVGQSVVSCFNGPADVQSFDLITHQLSTTKKPNHKNSKRQRLETFYQRVRDWREGKDRTVSRGKIFDELQKNYPTDWLLAIELFELYAIEKNLKKLDVIKNYLEQIKQNTPKLGNLIDDGLALVEETMVKQL